MADLGDKAAILPEHRAAILAVRPDLDGVPMLLRADGWDCLAIEVAGTTIFKVPHHHGAVSRLRREPATLDLIRPHVGLALPQMVLHERPILMSEHRKIVGEPIDPERYAVLAEPTREALADDLAAFFAGIHAIPPAVVRAADCDAVRPWASSRSLLARLEGRVGAPILAMARQVVEAHDRYGRDDVVFGQFDTHGWNMAFDTARDRLHGLFDFAGAGIGPLHRDLSYIFFVSPDLAVRVMARYGALTGRPVDAARAADAHGFLRVIELCDELDGSEPVTRFEDAIAQFCQMRCSFLQG
ncbi:MAG: aminoglycoside phosphotransferase family protein [Pseudomonadota bacterium]